MQDEVGDSGNKRKGAQLKHEAGGNEGSTTTKMGRLNEQIQRRRKTGGKRMEESGRSE